jgi:hypothetical protein
MTDETEKKGKKAPKDEHAFLELATKRLKREIDADDHNRQAAIEDLKFLNGDQWDPAEEQRRRLRGRPCLKTNELPKYVNQVVGDMRHNRARIKVRPVDSAGDVNIAKIRSGVIANIEYLSNAEAIYDYAGEMATSCGLGAWRVLTRYTEENPFVQEIYLERIKNPFLVYMDSNAKSEVGADSKYGFCLEKVTREEFEERYPDEEPPGDALKVGKGVANEVWFENDAFFIADYYVIESEKTDMVLTEDGQTWKKEEFEEKLAEWIEAEKAKILFPAPPALPARPRWRGDTPPTTETTRGVSPQLLGATERLPVSPMGAPPGPPGMPSTPPVQSPNPSVAGQQGQQSPSVLPLIKPPAPVPPPSLTIAKEREVEYPKVRHYAICADRILDGPNDVPGKYIPLVVVKGPERVIEGKTYVRSLIRDAKDPQRLLNFWVTDAAEIVDMIPKAPWIGTAKQFEGYEQDYAAANAENFPFLKYNIDQGAPPPQRMNPPNPPTAVFEQIGQAKQAIKDTIGMFGSEVGDKGPELSGKAILQRQKPGDVGTFAFIDNLSRAIAHCGRVINEMIPEVYDTQRDIRIRNVDDTETFVPVNTTAGAALDAVMRNPEQYQGMDKNKLIRLAAKNGRNARYNDLTAGKYDVVVTTGPSYSTQRQEAAQSLERLVAAYPPIMKIAGDLVYKFQDFLGAEEIAERVEKTMPPTLVPPKEGEPRIQPPPPPLVLVKMEELKVKQMHLEVEKEKLLVQKLKALKEAQETSGEVRKMLLGLLGEIFKGGMAGAPVGAPVRPAGATPPLATYQE